MQGSDIETARLIGTLIGAVLVGIFCGLAPLITGIVRKKLTLGIVGLVCCIIGGFILGIILALPLAVIFTIVIVTRKSEQNPPPPPTNF